MKSAFLFWFLLAVSLGAYSQAPPRSGRTITPTRQVAQFSELENRWGDAIQHKDQAALDHMLTDDFEVETPLDGPIDRDEFIDDAVKNLNADSYRFSHMTVHEYGDTAVVSFIVNAKGQFQGRNLGGQFWVIDVWRKNRDVWQAAARYVSKAGVVPAAARAVPNSKQ